MSIVSRCTLYGETTALLFSLDSGTCSLSAASSFLLLLLLPWPEPQGQFSTIYSSSYDVISTALVGACDLVLASQFDLH